MSLFTSHFHSFFFFKCTFWQRGSFIFTYSLMLMKTSAHHRIITLVCVSAVLDFSTEIHISVTFTEESKLNQHFPLTVNTYVCYIER